MSEKTPTDAIDHVPTSEDVLPKIVIICGAEHEVREVEDLGHDDTNYYGYIDHMERTIEVEKNMKLDVKVQALIHEMMHGLLLQTGQSGYEWEERIVQMLGCQLPKLLRDNPELVELMLRSDNCNSQGL